MCDWDPGLSRAFGGLHGFQDRLQERVDHAMRLGAHGGELQPDAVDLPGSGAVLGPLVHHPGVQDDQQIVSKTVMTMLGNLVATNRIMTKIVGVGFTAKDVQLTLQRGAGAGPVSIVKLVLCGRVETKQEFS